MEGFRGFLGKGKPTTQNSSVMDPLAQVRHHQSELERHEHRAGVFWGRIHSKKMTRGKVSREVRYHKRYTYHMDMARHHRDQLAKITHKHAEIRDPAKPASMKPRGV